MKSLVIALLFCAAGLAHAQDSPKPPSAPSNPDQLFPPPPLQAPGKPQFKWQYPDASHRFFLPQPPDVQVPIKPSIGQDVDPGILRKPQGFSQHPSRPAPHGNLYPGLKIQPTEIAKLEGVSAYPRFKGEPIPRFFPKARLEPIPITWDGFKMVPVETGSPANP